MKKIIIAMIFMTFILFDIGGLITGLFMSVLGGSVEQTYLYPLYGGMVVLAGIIVGAAEIIREDIKALKEGTPSKTKLLSEQIREHANEEKESEPEK